MGLAFTTEPFTTTIQAVGPASVELVLSSTAPDTDLYAVLSDVWPDGSAHPMAAGRLKSTFPGVDVARSLVDPAGNIVQPYGTYDVEDPADIGEERRYHVELWPIGNQFDVGHRLRLHVIGVSGASQPGPPAIHTIRLGPEGSRLLFPLLPGSDLTAALSPSPPTTSTPPADGPRAMTATEADRTSLPRTGGDRSAAPVVVATLVAVLAAHRLRRFGSPTARATGGARRW
jgi:predicted acyl esterase